MKQIFIFILLTSSFVMNAQIDYVYKPPYDLMQKLLEKKQREYNGQVSTDKRLSCQTMYEIVFNHGVKQDNIIPISSSMVVKANFYTYLNKNYVIANLKSKNSDLNGVPYIFCNVPLENWKNFKLEGIYGSYGEAFHQYIKEFTCDCK